MFFIVYASSATEDFTREQLLELLARSRANNVAIDITGILLYKDGNFIQVLEGEEETVRTLYAKIAKDRRHKGITLLLQGVEAERQFPGWSMGFRDLKDPDVVTLPGYSEFLNTPLTGPEFADNPTRCQRLLLVFKRNMR